MRSHFSPEPIGTTNMKSHFRPANRLAMACAVTSATAMMAGVCSGAFALDQASGATYSGGWAAGQNGGFGFGPWSFNGTQDPNNNPDPGAQQTMSSAWSFGTGWTMFNLGSAPAGSGISDVGRAITGGLQIGQTFETVIQNPTGYHFFGGYDILFGNMTDNLPGGNNSATLRVSEFNYYTSFPFWNVDDATSKRTSSLSSVTTATAGMKLDLTLTSGNSYSLTLTPLSNPLGAVTLTGGYTNTVDYVNFRLYDNMSTGPNDTANNFGIEYMTIVPEPTSLALIGFGAAGLWFLRRRK
jgi:hypothetical protein